jgi:hypothetical protein
MHRIDTEDKIYTLIKGEHFEAISTRLRGFYLKGSM